MMIQKNLIGQTIGNYRIESLLANGGFGAVYLGRHIIFADRPPVAIKLLHDSLASQLEYDRFVQEALLLEKLKHPHILPLIDAGIEHNLPYIITTYASHGSLLDRIRRSAPHPLPLDEALTILSQVGQALHYAHQRGVIHRDLKPVNILFNAQGDALLADFGIAAVSDLARTMVVDATGTPPYMAPEQFSNQASTKSDQYALACVAYELFTTHHPFIVVPESNSLLWMQKHLQEAPLPPRAYNPSLPPHIEQALLKALAKDRQDRYPDVAAFIQALQGAPVPLPATIAASVPQQALAPVPLASPVAATESATAVADPALPVVVAPRPAPVPAQRPAPQMMRFSPPMPVPPVRIMPVMRGLAALSYLFYGLGGILFLLFWPNQKPFERFHAVQATLLSLFYGILSTLFLFTSRTHPRVGDGALSLLNLVMIILTVIMIISALLGKTVRLPILGNIARAYSEKKPLYNQQQLDAVPGSTSITPVHIPSGVRVLAALSYLFFFVSGLVGLLRARKNRFIRFHALQSLCFFSLMLVCLYLASAFPVFLLPIAAGWLSGMIAACSGKYYRMPLVGTFVARMISRDRTLQ